MRRLLPLLLVLPLLVLATGCDASKPGEKVVAPTPSTVEGDLPKAEQADIPAAYQNGDPTAGKAVFTGAGGCGGCHTLKDAGTSGAVGPKFDETKPSLSKAVNRIANGLNGMPSFKGNLSDKQIADVASYVVKASGGDLNG